MNATVRLLRWVGIGATFGPQLNPTAGIGTRVRWFLPELMLAGMTHSAPAQDQFYIYLNPDGTVTVHKGAWCPDGALIIPDGLVALRCCGHLVQLGYHGAAGLLERRDQCHQTFHDQVVTGIGIHQAGVHMELATVHQSSLDTLLNTSQKDPFENLRPRNASGPSRARCDWGWECPGRNPGTRDGPTAPPVGS